MALEFTNIPDREGPAVYIIGDGTAQLEQQLIAFGEDVDKLTPDETQVVYLDPNKDDGLKVKSFYSLQYLPVIMIIMDDDTLYQTWTSDIPRPDEVAYYLSQINGTMAQ